MKLFYDIYEKSLKKHGEELSGDAVKISRGGGKTVVVLSDGLGSGVKANILATLTTGIVNTMLAHEVPLEEVIRTVLGTLPICQTRQMAYATFTVLEIDERKNHFKVINSENPPIFLLREGKAVQPAQSSERVLGREVVAYHGELRQGDFIGLATDGVLYAGLGKVMNFGWGWDHIAQFLEEALTAKEMSAEEIVSCLLDEVEALYGGEVGDDATLVGVQAREQRKLIVFTGPPIDRDKEGRVVDEFMRFDGKKIVCGGTTANIVARHIGEPIETDLESMSEDVPPIGRMRSVDLLTEGIITLARVIEYLKKNRPSPSGEKVRNHGALRLMAEMLYADHIVFFVGRTINPFYQNPLLPKNISIRLGLVNELAEILRGLRKDVSVRLF